MGVNVRYEKCKRKPKSLAGYRFVVKMHFKDAKEATQQNDALFLSFIHQCKPTSRYDVTEHLRYDVTGLELPVWPETFT